MIIVVLAQHRVLVQASLKGLYILPNLGLIVVGASAQPVATHLTACARVASRPFDYLVFRRTAREGAWR